MIANNFVLETLGRNEVKIDEIIKKMYFFSNYNNVSNFYFT